MRATCPDSCDTTSIMVLRDRRAVQVELDAGLHHDGARRGVLPASGKLHCPAALHLGDVVDGLVDLRLIRRAVRVDVAAITTSGRNDYDDTSQYPKPEPMAGGDKSCHVVTQSLRPILHDLPEDQDRLGHGCWAEFGLHTDTSDCRVDVLLLPCSANCQCIGFSRNNP